MVTALVVPKLDSQSAPGAVAALGSDSCGAGHDYGAGDGELHPAGRIVGLISRTTFRVFPFSLCSLLLSQFFVSSCSQKPQNLSKTSRESAPNFLFRQFPACFHSSDRLRGISGNSSTCSFGCTVPCRTQTSPTPRDHRRAPGTRSYAPADVDLWSELSDREDTLRSRRVLWSGPAVLGLRK
jgi:hypothetical protein